MRKLIIVVDHLPYPELSPNARHHWAVKARAVRASREEIGWLAKVEWHDNKPMVMARISYQFCVTDKRHRDLDNLLAMCKPWQDGLIDAGIIFYDDAKHLELGNIDIILNNTNKTIITVEELQ